MGKKQRITRAQHGAIMTHMEQLDAGSYTPHLASERSSIVEGMLNVTFYDSEGRTLMDIEYGVTGREWRNGEWV